VKAWDVFLEGKIIDTVYFDEDIEADQVMDSLINHDGYDPRIRAYAVNPNYVCTVCGVNWVDAEAGFDTCEDCQSRR
jgi:rubrerythrin